MSEREPPKIVSVMSSEAYLTRDPKFAYICAVGWLKYLDVAYDVSQCTETGLRSHESRYQRHYHHRLLGREVPSSEALPPYP